jgi:hypothetical protein
VIAEEYLYAYRRRTVERCIRRLLRNHTPISGPEMHKRITALRRGPPCSQADVESALRRMVFEGDIRFEEGGYQLIKNQAAEARKRSNA